jgi:ABC-type nickel/cobalt efflux system permease component RcnA
MANGSKLLDKLPLAPVAAGMFALVAGILVIMTPAWLLTSLVMASGLPALLPAAKPPLGDTAHVLSAFAAALLVGFGLWLAITVFGRLIAARQARSGPKARGVVIPPAPVKPGHRAPIFATQELGAPFMSDEAIAVARKELVLDAPLEESSVAAPLAAAGETAPPETALTPGHEIPESLSPPDDHSALTAVQNAHLQEGARGGDLQNEPPGLAPTIATLMARFEMALAARAMSDKPESLGDISSLRRALGVAR